MSKGIQNNRIRTIDIIYTRKGRFYKSINSPKAEITKFALSDDGIDYSLYDENLPDAEKAKKILNTPQFSSWSNELSLMRNKLISRERNNTTSEVPNMIVEPSLVQFDLTRIDRVVTQNITVNVNFPSPNGFKVTLSDNTYLTILDDITTVSGRDDRRDDEGGRVRDPNVGGGGDRDGDGRIDRGVTRLNPNLDFSRTREPIRDYDRYTEMEINNGGVPQSRLLGTNDKNSSSFTIPITYNGEVAPISRINTTISERINIESLDEGMVKQVSVIIKYAGLV